MNLGADMVRDQAHDALAIGGGQRSPVSASPSDSRSIQSRPSGSASPRRRRVFQKPGDGGPSAVRSMRAPREIARQDALLNRDPRSSAPSSPGSAACPRP
jgi:hypothetical protein